MLGHANAFFKYSNILKLKSFNKVAINSYIWTVRNIMKHMFFYIYKKTVFFRILSSFKMLLFLIHFTKESHVSTIILYFKLYNVLKDKYLLSYYYSYRNSYFFFDFISSHIHSFFSDVLILNTYTKNSLLVSCDSFLRMYKQILHINYIWLFSIKFLNFYPLNSVSLPTKRKRYNVLRSPHKDKKAREIFLLKKLQSNFSYPSFLNDLSIFISFNEAVLLSNRITLVKHSCL